MSRTIFLILIIYALLLAGLATLHGELLALALPFVVYLLAGFWRASDKLDLVVRRKLSTERATPGDDVVVTLEVTNRGADIEELRLTDDLPPGLNLRDGTPDHLLSLKRADPIPGRIPSMDRAVAIPSGVSASRPWITSGYGHASNRSRPEAICSSSHL